jgi:hypothetical protein
MPLRDEFGNWVPTAREENLRVGHPEWNVLRPDLGDYTGGLVLHSLFADEPLPPPDVTSVTVTTEPPEPISPILAGILGAEQEASLVTRPELPEEPFHWPEPLTVDVTSGTPEPMPSVIGELPSSPFPEEGNVPIDFPSLRELIDIGLGFVPRPGGTTFQGPQPQIRTGVQGAAVCPPGRVPRRSCKGGVICAKKARMNVANRHALGRASRRVKGFMQLAKTTEKHLRQSFAPLLRQPRRGGSRGSCQGCGARTRATCVC